MPKLLSDKIQEFIDWLESETDFAVWEDYIKVDVQKKLIEIMTTPEKKEHKWYFYMNGTFCTRCNEPIGTDKECI